MSVKIEKREGETVLVGCHDKPIAKAEAGGLRIHSKHGSDKCKPLISWEEIEEAKRRATSDV
jgi:hypothetical protein